MGATALAPRSTVAGARYCARVASPPRPSWLYLLVGGAELARRAGRLPARATGVEHVPATAARARGEPLVELRPVAARDPVLPAPLLPVHGEGGAVLVPARLDRRGGRRLSGRRGERDERGDRDGRRARREGHAVVMFPEGTRRRKGMRKRHEARWRTGAARIALEAGVPLVPGGHRRNGAPRAARPAARRVRRADRGRRSRGLAADEAATGRDRAAASTRSRRSSWRRRVAE